jgi:hypothetical protein
MGFAGKSGSSAKALGSLRQFGLIDGLGENTRVSDLAFAILEPVSENEKGEALIEAATKPDVFRDVLNRFDNRIPQANEPIRAFLIRELGFQNKAAESCIGALRDSFAFASVESSESQSAEETSSDGNGDEGPPTDSNTEGPAPSAVQENGKTTEFVAIPLSKTCKAEIRLVGDIDHDAINRLIQHIELMKNVWAD